LVYCAFTILALSGQVNNESKSWIEISNYDTILDLSQDVTYYIDHPPFSIFSQIGNKSFTALSKEELAKEWADGLNRRFWFKFHITNNSDNVIKDSKIHLGISDRIFLYQINSGEIQLIAKKGTDYRRSTNPDFPLYFDFPISIEPGDSISYLAHMSNAYIPEAFESIRPFIIKKGYEEFLYQPSRTARSLGLVYLGVLTIILVLFIIGIALFITLRDFSILSFSILCLSFIIYYSRDLDKLISSFSLWDMPDEFLSRSEPMARTFMTFAFVLFTFSYFKHFRFRNQYKYASIGVILFGMIGGIRALILNPVDIMNIHTRTDILFHNGFMILSMILTGFILVTLWFSVEYYAKFYILGTALFALCNYCGIIIENLLPYEGSISHLNKYASLTGVLLFTLAIAYMILQRILSQEKQFILKTAEVQQLNVLNKAKSEFYTNVTHEFRTPLTVILGMANSLKKATVEKNLIIKNAKTLLTLVNQLLSYSKNSDVGIPNISKEKEIVNYIESIIEPLKYHAEQKYIKLQLSTTSSEIRMDYDISAIQKIINNLVYNAIKFSPPHTTILVYLSKDEKYFHCQVTDEGIGIPKDELPYIFERYYQIENAQLEGNPTGTGIGLSIVKELVEQMKGTISADSTYGHGTTVKLQLPLRSEHKNILPIEQASTPTFPTKRNKSEDNRACILIVEDNEDVLLYTKRCLEDRYVIIEAHDGEEGIALALEEIPDLIVSDVMMPNKNGFELTKKLKSDPRTDHIPIVLLTAKATQFEMIQGLSIGADDYIFKPFDRRELELRIDNIINGRKRAADKNRLLARNDIKQLPPWLQQFEKLIVANVNKPINSEWLSERFQLSRSQIHRKIKQLTGLTPTQYIHQIKLKKAKELLINTDLSIEEIGIQLGFKTLSYFSASFKKEHGITPSQSRQSKHL